MRPRLRDILIDAVAREPDISVIEGDTSDANLSRVHPDVAVCGSDSALDGLRPESLLRILPGCRVLMVEHSGRRAVLFELRPTRVALREVSMDSVVDAIRSAGRRDHFPWRWSTVSAAPRREVRPQATAQTAPVESETGRPPRRSWREKP
jgi:hypothetical protein